MRSSAPDIVRVLNSRFPPSAIASPGVDTEIQQGLVYLIGVRHDVRYLCVEIQGDGRRFWNISLNSFVSPRSKPLRSVGSNFGSLLRAMVSNCRANAAPWSTVLTTTSPASITHAGS